MRGRVLFLDDMSARHKAFAAAALGQDVDVHHVFNACDAIRALNSRAYDQAFLDHDLSEEDIMVIPGQPSHVPTGMTVVDHIATMEHPPKSIVVHSCNEPAAQEMERRLRAARPAVKVTRIAFPYLMQRMASR